MSTNDDSRSLPKSMRHKQVLDVAEDNPDASIKELASQVPSATVELVERVLEKHGDPASDDVPAESESGEATQDRGEEAADEPTAAGANRSTPRPIPRTTRPKRTPTRASRPRSKAARPIQTTRAS